MKKIVLFLFILLCLCGCAVNVDKGNLIVYKERPTATHNLSEYTIRLFETNGLCNYHLIVTAPTGTYRINDTLTLVSIKHE